MAPKLVRITLNTMHPLIKVLEYGEEKEEGIEWVPQDLAFVKTLLLMMSPEDEPIYVENIPYELLEKMLDPKLTINVGSPTVAASVDKVLKAPLQHTYEPEPAQHPGIARVQEVIRQIPGAPAMSKHEGKTWLQLVQIGLTNPAPGQTTLANTVYVMPVEFLKDDWEPLKDALQGTFKNQVNWTRAGKESYWAVTF